MRARKRLNSEAPRHADTNTELLKAGTIEGRNTANILLDTGCSRTIVHQEFVPKEKIIEGEAVNIHCAHGDTVLYPVAVVNIEIDGEPFEVQAAVADRLPTAMLLGTDVAHLSKLLNYQSQVIIQSWRVHL